MGLEIVANKDKTLTVVAKQGTTWVLTLTLTNADNSPVDLTGYSARGQIRPSYTSPTVVASFTTSITDNVVTCLVPASITANVPAYKTSIAIKTPPKWEEVQGCYVFDIEIYNTDGYVERVAEGVWYVDPEVTR